MHKYYCRASPSHVGMVGEDCRDEDACSKWTQLTSVACVYVHEQKMCLLLPVYALPDVVKVVLHKFF